MDFSEAKKLYIDLDLDGLRETLLQTLVGANCPIDTGAFQNDMTSIHSRDDVLPFLIHLRYLAYDSAEKTVFVPNKKVLQEFSGCETSEA